MADILVDTDIFVDHLRGAAPLRASSHRLSFSVITRAELVAGTSATATIHDLLSPFREIPVGSAVAERAGRIRRETGLKLPDALIAATAVEHSLGLASRNERDFSRVRGLRLRRLR